MTITGLRSAAAIVAAISVVSVSGCVKYHLREATVPEVAPGAPGSASMGDTILFWRDCPCLETFIAKRKIELVGNRPINRGEIWIAKHRDAAGSLFLTSNSYHPELAIVIRGGLITPEAALVQHRGARQWRSWPLEDEGHADAFAHHGFSYRRGWRVQYLGPLDGDLQRLRFSVEDVSPIGAGGEALGQVTYVHDLRNGPEFVIRGQTIVIREVSMNGVIEYSVE